LETEHYRELLNTLKFKELEQAFTVMPYSEMQDILYQLAYDQVNEEVNLLVYTFFLSLLLGQESASIHMSISVLMGTILNHVHNAESVGLFHGLRAAELQPEDIDILEFLLYYNHIPEKLLSDSDAIAFARKVLLKRPESIAAQMTLKENKF
jgi:hypothetical protein